MDKQQFMLDFVRELSHTVQPLYGNCHTPYNRLYRNCHTPYNRFVSKSISSNQLMILSSDRLWPYNFFFSSHERTKAYCWDTKWIWIKHAMIAKSAQMSKLHNLVHFRPRKDKHFLLLHCGSRKLIWRYLENRRKEVIYYFQIKINMYDVISHSIPFII